MALINIPTDHVKLKKTLSIEKKPLMLKDYLFRDDLSTCSSNGFKSFPSRQCCTTIRFLLEADLKISKDNYPSTTKRILKRSRSEPCSTTISALQRASEAVLKAVTLPFPSIKSSSLLSLQSNSWMKGYISRSFSRRLFKRSLWRKEEKEVDRGEIRHWKSFREFLEEENQPSDQNAITHVNTTTDTSSTIMTTRRVSRSSSSNSWTESEFTAETSQSSGGSSESSSDNDVVKGKTNLPEKKKVSNIVGVTVGEDSNNFTKEQDWPNGGGKEQFSPVSVLDCPFDDEEEEDSNSPFNDRLARVQGTKQKHMQKMPRFEGLAQLEQVDLLKRIAMAMLEDENSQPKSTKKAICQQRQEEDREAIDEKILQLFKAKIPSDIIKFKADTLFLDFFRERLMADDNAKRVINVGDEEFGVDVLKVAEDWVNGNGAVEMVLGCWEVEEGRKVYVKEMEKSEDWRNFKNEKEEMGSAVELEVFSLLVDELFSDLMIS